MTRHRLLVPLFVGGTLLLPAVAAEAEAPDDLEELDQLDALDELEGLDASTDSRSLLQLREFKGHVAFELRSYVLDRDSGKENAQLLSELQADVQLDIGSRVSLFATPRLLVDALDTALHRFEPLEAYLSVAGERWDFRVGQFVDNLGIVDAFNPLDVLNRRDLATDIVDPVRLGELGARLRLQFEGGPVFGEPTLSVYLLPLWRATELPTEQSRFSLSQGPVTLREDLAVEPEGHEQLLVGARFEHTLTTRVANADIQYLATRGPERIPAFLPMPRPNGDVDLAPHYYGVNVVGFGFRAVPNAPGWSRYTFKSEVAYKQPYRLADGDMTTPRPYVQYAFGVDRTIDGIVSSKDQLQLMVEYLGESGASDPTAELRPFDHDAVLRLYWQAGDFARSSVEVRGIVDVTTAELIAEVAARRQLRFIHDDLRVEVSAQMFRPERDTPGFFGLFPNNSNVRARLQFDF